VERLALTSSGQVHYQLKTAYRDGTTHIALDTCARCGGKLEVIASIEEPKIIANILAHRDKAAPEYARPELPLGARGREIQGEDRGYGLEAPRLPGWAV